MRKVAFALVSALLMIVVGDALAPDAPAQSQPPAASSAEVPPVGEFGDEAAARFAPAALEMERIAASNSMAEEEQRAAMINAVRQVGRKLQGFHQIALAHQADAGLPQRIEVAAEQHVAEAQQGQPAQNQKAVWQRGDSGSCQRAGGSVPQAQLLEMN